MSFDAFNNRLSGRNGQGFTTHQQLTIQEKAKSTAYADYVAFESGGVFINLPDVASVDNVDVGEKLMQMHADFGSMSKEYFDATRDGEISDEEKARLTELKNKACKSLHEWLALSFLVFCK